MAEGTPRKWARAAALALLTAGSIAVAANAALGSSSRADLADFSVRAVSAKSAQVRAGGLIRATATVVNTGERRGRPTLLGYYLSLDRKRGRQDIQLRPGVRLRALGPGGWLRHAGPLRIPTTVAHRRFRLLACADASRRLDEASERNNCRAAAKPLTVTRRRSGPSPVDPGGSPPSTGPAGEPAPGPAPPEEDPPAPDETAPTPALTQPAEGAQANDSTPLIAGQASTDPGDSGTVTVDIHAGAMGLGPPVESLTAVRGQDGTWSVESEHLNDGRYVAEAKQTDAAGNVGTSAPRSFTIDTAAPAVTLNAPPPVRSNDSTPTFEGAAGDDPADSGTVTVKLWNGTGTSGSPSHTFTTSRSAASWSTTQALQDGTYTARAEQADAAGNTGVSTARTFTVDTAAPGVTLSGPPAGPANDGTPTFGGSAGNADGDAATITVKVWSGTGTSGSPAHTFTTSRSGGSWSTTQALQDGTFTARAEQADAAGNTGVSTARTFTVDTDPPDVGITSPGAGAVVTDSTPSLSGPAGDSPGDANTVRVRIYEGTGTAGPLRQDHTVARSGSTWSVDAGALSDGTYTVRADQVDSAGNSVSVMRTFSIDALGPAVRLDHPADGSSTNEQTPTFDGAAGDAPGDSSTVTVKIYAGTAASGNPVKTLTATRNGTGWSIDSTSLVDGTYTARAEQTDAAGNTGVSATRTFTVDTDPPDVTLSGPPAGASNDGTPTFQGNAGNAAGDAATIRVKVWNGTGTGGTPGHTFTTSRSAGSWSTTQPLADGTYTARAEQVDAAGNTGVSATRTFTVDTHPPDVGISQPAAGAVVTDTAPTLSGPAGAAAGDASTVRVRIYEGTGTAGALKQDHTVSRIGSSWSVTAGALSDGTYTARADQVDTAGNSGSVTRTFSVDALGPAVGLANPAHGSSTNDPTPALNGAAGNALGDSLTVTVKIYSGSLASGNAVHSLTTTRIGASWAVDAPTLGDGTYTARAEQGDSAGHTAFSAAHTFTVDTASPAVTLTTPPAGDSSDATPTFSGLAGNGAGDSATVTVRVWQGTATTGAPHRTLTTSHSGGNWSVTAASLADGTYTARAEQADAAGNTGQSANRTFTIDTAAPAVTLSAPPAGSSSDATPTFQGNAGNATGDAATITVKVWAGSGTAGNPAHTFTTSRSGGSWSTTQALADGTYTARAEQADTAGNTGVSATRTFTVDTEPPDVTLSGPGTGTSNDGTPTFQGSAGNATGDAATVTIKVWNGSGTGGNPAHTFTTSRSEGTWSTTQALADGTYTARAEQADAAGNTGHSSERTFTIDTAAPVVGLTSPTDLSSGADDTPTLQGTSSEAGQVTVRIHSGSSTAGAVVQTRTATVSNGNWSVDALPLTEDTYTAQAQQSDAAGNTGMSGAHRFSVPATLLAVGDISTCANDNDEATAALADTRPGTVATLGDHVYEHGTAAEFSTCYHPTWGRHKARTKPTPGDHEYEDPAGNAAGYFGYFGAAAGDPAKGYYSYDLGNWHVVVLNSNVCVAVGCDPTSPQVQWLRADLEANQSTCTLAYWHHPRFTSERAPTTSVQAFWDVLYEKDADLILNGDSHNYERFAPQTPAEAVDTNRGIRQLLVGTGGRSLRPIATRNPNSEVAQWDTYGILKVTLRASSYSWQFVPVAGGTFTDSGTTDCH